MRRRLALAWALVLASLVVWAMVLPGCAGTFSYHRSVEAAKASYTTYTSLAPEVAQKIADMVQIARGRSLGPEEKNRLRRLDALGKDLEAYRNLHNTYIDALVLDRDGADFGGRLGEEGDPSPDVTFRQMKRLLSRIIDEALSLGLSFTAVRL